MELVTGKAGTPHVSSADDGRRIAGEVGAGSYVLKTGGGLAPSLVDANTIRFATGDIVVQGRHIGLTAPEDVKVASGTQGKKRTDYICVHYKRDVSGANPTLVETCEWKVLQGTPGTDAAAPAVPAGSILDGDAEATVPVASVDFDGLTTGEPKLLIPTLTPLADLGDSVSQSEPVVLFNNWSNAINAGATLAEPINNFSRVTFSFRTNDGFLAPDVTVFYPKGDVTNIVANAIYSRPDGNLYIKTRGFTVRGTKVETSRDGVAYSIAEHNLTTGETKHIDVITVVRVMGWR
jgi:hypothetical protein